VFDRNLGRVILVLSVGCSAVASAQQPATEGRPYDGIQAGLDAFRLAEEKRQAAVSQQLSLNDQMRFWNGYPTSRGQTMYYGYLSPAAMAAYGYGIPATGYGNGSRYASPLSSRANLDYIYAYGGGSLWGGYNQGWADAWAVFQPWPYVPGNIYGYPAYYQPARQPIGQQQLQTGPNSWESHPVYDPPLTMYQPLPPVNSPRLDRTPYAEQKEPPLPGETIPPEPPPAASPTTPEPTPPGPASSWPPSAPRRGPRER
jgi:hypothetical protein